MSKPDDALQFRANRLRTFSEGVKIGNSKTAKQWTLKLVDPGQLADLGFYYTPTRKFPNQVTCFWCGKKERNLETVLSIAEFHLSNSPLCPYSLIALNLGKFIEDSDKNTFWQRLTDEGTALEAVLHPHSIASTQLRQSTFKLFWKYDKKRRCKVTSRGLAKAGFYYCPVDPGSDRVICMYCDCPLEDWSTTDDPLEEHKNNSFTYCYFLDTISKTLPKIKKPQTQSSSVYEDDLSEDNSHGSPMNLTIRGHSSGTPSPKIRQVTPDFDAFDFSVEDLENHDLATIFNSKKVQDNKTRKYHRRTDKENGPAQKKKLPPDNGISLVLEVKEAPEDQEIENVDLPIHEDVNHSFPNLDISKLNGHITTRSNNYSESFNLSPSQSEEVSEFTPSISSPGIEANSKKRKTKPPGVPAKRAKSQFSDDDLGLNQAQLEEILNSPRKGKKMKKLNTNGGVPSSPAIFDLSNQNIGDYSEEHISFIEKNIQVKESARNEKEAKGEKIGDLKQNPEVELEVLSLSKSKKKAKKSLQSQLDDMVTDQAKLSMKPNATNREALKEKEVSVMIPNDVPTTGTPTKSVIDTNEIDILDVKAEKVTVEKGNGVNREEGNDKVINLDVVYDKVMYNQVVDEELVNEEVLNKQVTNKEVIDEEATNKHIFKKDVDSSDQIIDNGEANDENLLTSPGQIGHETNAIRSTSTPDKAMMQNETDIAGPDNLQKPRKTPEYENVPEPKSLPKASEIQPEQFNQDKSADHESTYHTADQNEDIDSNVEPVEQKTEVADNFSDMVVDSLLPLAELVPKEIFQAMSDSEREAHVSDKMEDDNSVVDLHFDSNSKLIHDDINVSAHAEEIAFLETDTDMDKEKQVSEDETPLGDAPIKEVPKDVTFEENEAYEYNPVVDESMKNSSEGKLPSVERKEPENTVEYEQQVASAEVSHHQKMEADVNVKDAELEVSEYIERSNVADNKVVEAKAEANIVEVKADQKVEVKVDTEEKVKADTEEKVKADTEEKGKADAEMGVKGISKDDIPVESSYISEQSEVKDLEMSPLSYHEYVKDIKDIEDNFVEEPANEEKTRSVIEDSASEIPPFSSDYVNKMLKSPEITAAENYSDMKMGLSVTAVYGLVVPDGSLSKENSESSDAFQDDRQDISSEKSPSPQPRIPRERKFPISSPRKSMRTSSTADVEEAGDLTLGSFQRPSFSNVEASTPQSKSKDDETAQVTRKLPHVSLDAVTSEIQTFLETIAYLAEISTMLRELHNDAEGQLTQFIAEMPEEEEDMTIAEWMQHNAVTCSRAVRDVAERIIVSYEKSFDSVIAHVENMDTLD